MNWKHILTSFEGRINRGKFWAGVGVLWVLSLVLIGLDMSFLPPIIELQPGIGYGPLTLLMFAVSLYVGIALYVKRWHDRDKSGWWTLIALVPIIGGIWLLVECGFLPGTKGPNKFGPDPLG
ncbi:MAG: DUF805 domain-containing protein [Phyllobacteriaceae bacterium]|nr:DUF805 domain-containing protein [Phyllobacteriaceae bacterium]